MVLERASVGRDPVVHPTISPISWMPIALMILGIGDVPTHFLLAVSSVWPIVLSTAEGVRRVDRRWIEMARSLGATETETLRHVVIPAIAVHVMTGLRLGLGVADRAGPRRECWARELVWVMLVTLDARDRWPIPR